jgi:hypothetical protein
MAAVTAEGDDAAAHPVGTGLLAAAEGEASRSG